MYKVINIHIGGRIFQIEENAFETLSNYINSLKKYFEGKPEGPEIVSDIEHRIAEILLSKLNEVKTNITNEDVAAIIESMGSLKDIAGDESDEERADTSNSQTSSSYEYTTGKSKIYRDQDAKVIGGVCSGLGYYFDIDSTIVRLIFIAFFFAGGSSIFIYLILLIVIPEAKTTAEKLAMRKEKINIDTIRKSVEDEFGKIKGTFEKGNYQGRISAFFQKIFHVLGLIVAAFFKLIGKFIGLIFAIVAVSVFVGLISLIIGTTVMNGQQIGLFNSNYLNFFENTNDRLLAQVAAVLGLFSVILIFFNMSRSLLTAKGSTVNRRYFNRITGTISLLSFILIIISIAKTVSYFHSESAVEKKQFLDTNVKNYHIKTAHFKHRGSSFFVENDSLYLRNIELKIESTNGLPELVEIAEAHGQTINKAKANAANCSYQIEVKDSFIVLPESFLLKNNQSFRNQKIVFILRLPVGTQFKLDENIDLNVDGSTNTNDGLELGNAYFVQQDGIHCLNCSNFSASVNIETGDYDYSYPVNQMQKLTVSSALNIRIIKGTRLMLKARGFDDQSDLFVEEHNGHLEIHLKNSFLNNLKDDVEVLLVTPDLKSVEIEGAVEAEIEGFDNAEMEVFVSGASKCFAKISPVQLLIDIRGASEFELIGKSENFNVNAEGASKLEAMNFRAQNVIAEASGASKVEVYASKSIKATSKGASKISYTGNPSITDCTSSGAGKIEKED